MNSIIDVMVRIQLDPRIGGFNQYTANLSSVLTSAELRSHDPREGRGGQRGTDVPLL